MGLKTKKPTISSQRQLAQLSQKNLREKPLLKKHLKGLTSPNGVL